MMEAGEVEPEQLELESKANAKSKLEKYVLNPKSIAFNFIFSFVVIFLIVHAGNANILSIYGSVHSYGSSYNVYNSGYLRCGWNNFYAHFCRFHSCDISTESWLQQYNDCILYQSSDGDTCDYYNYPQSSGVIWFYCNIISIISLLISQAGYIGIVVRKKYFKSKIKKLKEMLYFTIFFQSFIPTLLLLIAIIYWFQTNSNNPGCWNNEYLYKYDNNSVISFSDKKLGESMIFDIIAVILVVMHLMINIHLLLIGTKKKNIKKHGMPMLGAAINGNEGIKDVEGEGYPDKYIENVSHIPMVSVIAIEPIQSQLDKIEHKSIKIWFDESVSIPNDINSEYKQDYYDKFIENGFDNFVAIKSMNNQDLIDIGIDKLGHRKTILIAIQKL